MVADTSEQMSQQKYRGSVPALVCPVFWLLGTNFMITAEEVDMTTAFKHEDAAAKGKGIV